MDAELEEEKPKRGSPSPDPPQPKAQAPVTASPESQAQECSPEGNPEKGDCSGQTKALWKPLLCLAALVFGGVARAILGL